MGERDEAAVVQALTAAGSRRALRGAAGVGPTCVCQLGSWRVWGSLGEGPCLTRRYRCTVLFWSQTLPERYTRQIKFSRQVYEPLSHQRFPKP